MRERKNANEWVFRVSNRLWTDFSQTWTYIYLDFFLAIINEWRSLQMEFQMFVIKWIKHYTLLEGCDIPNVEQGIGSHASLYDIPLNRKYIIYTKHQTRHLNLRKKQQQNNWVNIMNPSTYIKVKSNYQIFIY